MGRGPNGITVLGAEATRSGIDATEYALFVAAGLAFVACGMIAARGKAPGLTSGLLYAAGVVWLLEGLRLSSQPPLFTLGTQMTLLVLPVLIHLGMAFPDGHLGSTRARLFVGTLYVYYVIHNVSTWMFFDPQLHVPQGESTSVNLLLIGDQPATTATLRVIHSAIFVVIGIILVGILAYRWRIGTPAFRRSLLPLWWAFFLLTIVRRVVDTRCHRPSRDRRVVSIHHPLLGGPAGSHRDPDRAGPVPPRPWRDESNDGRPGIRTGRPGSIAGAPSADSARPDRRAVAMVGRGPGIRRPPAALSQPRFGFRAAGSDNSGSR